MRQINTILDQTPEGFDAQVKAAIQAIGAEPPPGDPHPDEYPDGPQRLIVTFVKVSYWLRPREDGSLLH